MKVEPFADGKCIKHTFGIPVGSCPIEGFSFFNNLMEPSAYFLEGCLVVEVMGIENINILKLKPFQ